jgi:hypothetical protein
MRSCLITFTQFGLIKRQNTTNSMTQINVHFFVANAFQIQPFHKGLAIQADVALKII